MEEVVGRGFDLWWCLSLAVWPNSDRFGLSLCVGGSGGDEGCGCWWFVAKVVVVGGESCGG